MPKGAWIPQIEVSTTEAGTAYIAVNDYRRNNWSAYAYMTKDYGATWKRIIDDNKIKSFINSIVQDDIQQNLLFAGADNGLYVSCLLYTSPSPRDLSTSRMPSSA